MASENTVRKGVWSDLPRRLVTVGIGAPILLWAANTPSVARVLLLGSHVVCAYEWIGMMASAPDTTAKEKDDHGNDGKETFEKKKTATTKKTKTNVVNVALCWVLYGSACVAVAHGNWVGLTWTAAVTTLILPERWSGHLTRGVLFVGMGQAHLQRLVSSAQARHLVFFLLVVWNTDTGALLAGRTLGRLEKKSSVTTAHRPPDGGKGRAFVSALRSLLKAVSPQKTLVGLLGGWILGTLTASVVPWCLPYLTTTSTAMNPNDNSYNTVDTDWWFQSPLARTLVGSVLSLGAILGDLVESKIKRIANIKDSGKLLPGHGGVLDRLDSFFLSAALYYYILYDIDLQWLGP